MKKNKKEAEVPSSTLENIVKKLNHRIIIDKQFV